jgi:hypothetical protein
MVDKVIDGSADSFNFLACIDLKASGLGAFPSNVNNVYACPNQIINPSANGRKERCSAGLVKRIFSTIENSHDQRLVGF